MRTTFIKTLTELARNDKSIYLITADLGFSVFENFEYEFKNRFINVGISEANMIGVASGLAMTGRKVICYSIIPFVTMRCFEQIRNDVCYQNLDVTLVGVGGGLSYGASGATHHAIEDIGIMRTLPNMKVICPGDPIEARYAVECSLKQGGPTYIRLNKNNEPILNSNHINFKIGESIKLSEGFDLSIIATGNMLEEAKKICDRLTNDGLSVKLISMHTIKPIDRVAVMECLQETKAIFTLEEHNIIGGLNSAVSEIIAQNIQKPIIFKPYAIPDVYADCVGSSEYFREKYKISEKDIYEDIKALIKR